MESSSPPLSCRRCLALTGCHHRGWREVLPQIPRDRRAACSLQGASLGPPLSQRSWRCPVTSEHPEPVWGELLHRGGLVPLLTCWVNRVALGVRGCGEGGTVYLGRSGAPPSLLWQDWLALGRQVGRSPGQSSHAHFVFVLPQNGFAVVRPPGHHADPSTAM